MKKKMIALNIGVVAVLMVIGAIIWRIYSLPIAVYSAGLNNRSISYIEQLDIDIRKQFSVFQTRTKEGKLALVYATRDAFGFWHIDRMKCADDAQDYATITWVKGAGTRRFSFLENAIFEHEWHFVFSGDNAIKAIEFLPDQLPSNSTVNIQQAGEHYLIHLVVFSEESVALDLREVLIQNGCIQDN